MKISAIFSDYDGTLAPEDVPLERSEVLKDIEEPLRRLGSSVPVAIVTSKDFGFIRPRTEFASAWACVSGLEIVLSDGRTFAPARTGDRLREGLNYVKGRDAVGLKLELKHGTTGDLLAFSVDWRGAPKPPNRFIGTASAHLTKMALKVVHDPTRPFFDVFGRKPDKGRAVRELKRLLNVAGKVLFMGDSAADNSAFEEAGVAICVEHGQDLDSIRSGFILRRDEVGRFLRSLADDDLYLDLRTLRRK